MNKPTKKKIIIQSGCISCGCCRYLAPDVFELKTCAQVKQDADLDANWEKIKKAAQECPVGVIELEEV